MCENGPKSGENVDYLNKCRALPTSLYKHTLYLLYYLYILYCIIYLYVLFCVYIKRYKNSIKPHKSGVFLTLTKTIFLQPFKNIIYKNCY